MPGFDIRSFLGIVPVFAPENLPNEGATRAVNTRLAGSVMQPWLAPLFVKALVSATPVKSIYRFGMTSPVETDFWFQWDTDVDVVRGPIAGDTEERTYWTGDGAYPKKAKADTATTAPPYPSNNLRLGIPIPAAAPSINVTGAAPGADDPLNTSVWGYTYVSSWGEEGPMSPLSAVATWGPAQTPHLTGMSTAPAGAYSIVSKRIYRSNTGTNTTDLQFVAEIAVGAASYDDTVASSALGGVSVTRLFTPPPDDLQGLSEMANKILVGFSGNTVRMSEPGIPFAWPQRYSYPFTSPVVGVKCFDQTVVVCCQRGTYILVGVDPASMAQSAVVGAGVCLAKRGMVNLIGGVAYPTRYGLQYIGPDGVRLITENVFDEYSWSAYKPDSFTAAAVNGRYVAAFDTGSKQGMLVFSPGSTESWVEMDIWGTALWTEKGTDRLYIVNGNNIARWDAGTALAALWRSKRYRYPRPISMAYAAVESDTYPLTFKLYGEGQLLFTKTVQNALAFALSTQNKEWRTYEVEVTVPGRTTHIRAATSMTELKAL